MEKQIEIPYRLAFVNGTSGRSVKLAVKGAPGTHGDAGWTLGSFDSEESARKFMKDNRAAEMPCWKFFGLAFFGA